MKLIKQFFIQEIPNYYVIGKKKRYTSMNLFYSNTHWSIRKGIVDRAKSTLKEHIDTSVLNSKANSIHIVYTYYSSRTSFDIENRLGFWSKVFLDYVKGTKAIPDDNVKTVKSICYESVYHSIKTDNLNICIYDISDKSNTKK